MSSYTFTFNGNTSVLRETLLEPLELVKDETWEAALLDFTTYNSIPNIIENFNNKLHYKKHITDELKVVELNTGSYEIDDISRILQQKLGRNNIRIKPNNNLLKSELYSAYSIDFSKEHSIGSVLGFSKDGGILPPRTLHFSDKPVQIIKVNSIDITCSITQGAYKEGVNGHIIYSLYPSVPPGYKIVEKPQNLIYFPVNVSQISDITLSINDQDGDPVNFRGETITATIHLRSRR